MIRIILFGLIVLLFIVLFISYFQLKEGFDTIVAQQGQLNNNVISDIGSGISTMNQTSQDIATSSTPIPIPAPMSVPAEQEDPMSEIVISGPGFDAMSLQKKSELLQNIQKLIRNESIVNRQTSNILELSQASSSESNTDALQQGQEFSSECKKKCEGPCPRNKDGSCPPVPDMSEYIRKDQIPCWNCTLDY